LRTLPMSSAPLAVNALLYPARKITLFGNNAASLSLCYAAQAACERHEIVYICGDNRFDPYTLARIARQHDQSREMALSRIFVARAFTGYQFTELVQQLDPNRAAGPVIISGICSAFFDEDISDNDAARLYYRTLSRLAELADRGLALLLTQTEEVVGKRRAYFLTDLFRASNFIFRLDGERTYTLEMRRYRPLLHSASVGEASTP
jgi:hypothetical protein